MSETWPPPADASTSWRYVTTRDEDSDTGWARVEMRPVRLWGREVLIARDERVFCDYCRELVPVEVLCQPGNGHAVSVVGIVPTGTLMTLEGDEP